MPVALQLGPLFVLLGGQLDGFFSNINLYERRPVFSQDLNLLLLDHPFQALRDRQLLHLAMAQTAQLVMPVGLPDEFIHLQVALLHYPPDLSVLARLQLYLQPHIGT